MNAIPLLDGQVMENNPNKGRDFLLLSHPCLSRGMAPKTKVVDLDLRCFSETN